MGNIKRNLLGLVLVVVGLFLLEVPVATSILNLLQHWLGVSIVLAGAYFWGVQ